MDTQQPPGAIGKAISLLVELQAADVAMGLSELSRRTGLAKSTTHRLLGDLTESGMIGRVGTRYEAVRPNRTHLVSSDPRGQALRDFAPFLGDLLIRTGLTSSLAVLRNTDVVFPHRVHGHGGTRTPSDDSGRESAVATAAGRLLLAHDPEAVRRLAGDWGHDSARVTDLDRHLLWIRRQRYSIRVGPTITCMAVPLRRDDASPDIALTVKGRSRDFDQRRVLAHLRFVADLAAQHVRCSA